MLMTGHVSVAKVERLYSIWRHSSSCVSETDVAIQRRQQVHRQREEQREFLPLPVVSDRFGEDPESDVNLCVRWRYYLSPSYVTLC